MKMPFNINKALLPMKAHYFLFNAGTGPVIPYLSVYIRYLGFSSVIVGLIYTILPLCGMVAKPLIGAVADRFKCQKKLFLVAQLLAAAASLAIFFVPKIELGASAQFSCTDGVAVFSSLPEIAIDTDAVTRIQEKNGTAKCKLICELEPSHFETICSEWKYCDNSTKNPSLTFTANVPLDRTQVFDAVVFRVPNVTIDGADVVPSCYRAEIRSLCAADCDDDDVNLLLTKTSVDDASAYGKYEFWLLLCLMIATWVGQAVVVSLGDAICFEMLGEKHNKYGRQRMFGALGWGILSLFSGVMIDVASRGKSYTDYSVAFYMGSAFLVLDFLASCTLKYTQTKLSTNILKDVGQLLLNARIVVYLAWCTVVGMCTGLIWNFLLWLVEDLANARRESNVKTLQGVIMGVQCLGGELPFFFLSGKILKWMGHINAMSLVLFALGIRFILYSVISDPWWFIPIEFSNGLTFGLFYACMASYASIVAPPGTEATMQGMVGAVFEGVGVSIGSLLAGISISDVAGPLTFRYFGVGALGACAAHVLAQFALKRKDAATVYTVRKNSLEKFHEEDQQELTSVEPFLTR